MIILIILIIGIVFTTLGSSSKLFLLACTNFSGSFKVTGKNTSNRRELN